MRKFSRREKRILKMLAAVCMVALVLEVEARFRQAKADLVLEIENQRSLLDTYLDKLKTDTTVDGYRTKTIEIETELEQFRDRVLELPRESDATLLIKETIDDKAAEIGMSINSISSRRSKELVKDQPMRELKTYFAFDSDLESLLEFYDAMSRQGYFMVIDSMNLGTRKRINRRGRRRNAKIKERPPLNGNSVLTTLFLINPEGSLESYLDGTKASTVKPAGESSRDTVTAPPEEEPKSKSAKVTLPPRPRSSSDSPVNQTVPSLGNQAQLISPSTQGTDGPPQVEPPAKGTNPLKNLRVQSKPRPLTDTTRRGKKRF